MDNGRIARILAETADLLEIKGENPFRIRAYRTAADTVGDHPAPVAQLPAPELLKLAGIGKDIAARIREIADTGDSAFHRELLEQVPVTLLDLLHLQGVGAKTAARLHALLGVRSLEDLEAAARQGRLRTLPGFGARKETLILRAIEERRRSAGRHLMADVDAVARSLLSSLADRHPEVEFVPVGSLRRGCDTCGDLDVLAVGGTPLVMATFAGHWRVDRVLGQGETKTSVRLDTGLQADLRLVPRESRGAALQYFTGSKPHNIALRDRAIRRGWKLNEYALTEIETGRVIAGESEAAIYEALGLQPVPPELREGRGEIEAAEARALPELVQLSDLRGDLHSHTTDSDGRDDLEAMARAAQARGLSYLAITDHSRALAMANGLDEQRVLAQAARIRDVNRRLDGFTLLAGIECDILPDGRLDLSEDCLAQLDIVVASVHSAFNQGDTELTERLLAALASPVVDVLAHPTGRLILKREGYRFDIERVLRAAAANRVALEINSQVDRLDLNDQHARLARDAGAKIVVSSDAHSTAGLAALRWGVVTARRAWLRAPDVLNTMTVEELRAWRRKKA